VALFVCIAGWRLGRRTIDTLTDTAPAGAAAKITVIVARVPSVTIPINVGNGNTPGGLLGPRLRDRRQQREPQHPLLHRWHQRRFWVHQVPKTASPVDPRVNLTFRRMIS
jgi:hypothetical protein